MVDRVPPVSATPGARAVRRSRMLVLRRNLENYAADPEPEPDAAEPRPAATPRSGAAAGAVGAQLLGERPRRGLRAGPEVLEQARSTYLQTEYAGRHDRRPRKGQITKTDV